MRILKNSPKIMLEIREERKDDIGFVRIVNDLAFNQKSEGNIVDKLRNSCKNILSLVAVSDQKIVGHILFSPAKIIHKDSEIIGMGLAPMAVLPEFQNKGIGSMLVREGIRRIKEMDYPFIIVLGHENYYPRFGFERASLHGLKSQWDGVPDEAFMVMIINKSVMAGIYGIAQYRSEFNKAM